MLSEREYQILEYLKENTESYVTSNELADYLDVSIRTVKSDLRSLKETLEKTNQINITSVRSKGYRLEIKDFKLYQSIINDYQNNISVSQSINRLNLIIHKLLMQPHTKVKLQQCFYVSESTINNDLQKIKQLLNKYELEIILNQNDFLHIVGNEQNIRKLLIHQVNHVLNKPDEDFIFIENILLKTLIEEEYNVSENVFNNILIHIRISAQRITSGNAISEIVNVDSKWEKELTISRKIFEEFDKIYKKNFSSLESEINNLAILIAGKSNYNQDYIPAEISNFIDQFYCEIEEKFNIKFPNNLELKLNLALHIIPLLERVKNNIHLGIENIDYIQQSFPLAIDISAYFSLKIKEKFNLSLPKNEIALLAIHFNNLLISYDESLGKKQILIVSNMRRSESILLRQRLLTWFREEISNVDVFNYSQAEQVDINNYDVIFSTDENKFTEKFSPILISKFPHENEFLKIKLAIDGFKDKEDILKLFRKELFFSGEISSKPGVFNKFEELLFDYFGPESIKLMDSVKQREQMSNTFFGNQIAFPHAAVPISSDTFVSVIHLKQPLLWNEDGDEVRIIMLVAIEKNNANSFQLWNYLSGLTKDSSFIKKIHKLNDYKSFIEILGESIEFRSKN